MLVRCLGFRSELAVGTNVALADELPWYMLALIAVNGIIIPDNNNR